MQVSKYWARGYTLVAVLYFFFNSLFLPEGLLYTAILTPFFLWWLYKEKSIRLTSYFFIFTIPFIPIHLYYGVDIWYYARSYLLLFSSFVFALSFYVFLKKGEKLDRLFMWLLILNFLFMLAALFTLWIPSLKDIFWYLKEFSPGISGMPRLRMLTYEPSYYALLFAPIAIFFFMKLLLFPTKQPGLIFIMAILPLLLSMSFGVISATVATLICLSACQPALFIHRKVAVRFILPAVSLFLIAIALVYVYDPENPVFGRIANIFSGDDTSFRGRTYESFILAWKIAKQKSVLFGCGLGQTKIIGIHVFKTYYGYLPPVVRIPNTLSDTLATYGLAGVVIRLAATIGLFFHTKVSRNYYRLALFLFIFIYQFTGSFLTNIVEYVIWILAFTPCFPEFNRDKLLEKTQKQPFTPVYSKQSYIV